MNNAELNTHNFIENNTNSNGEVNEQHKRSTRTKQSIIIPDHNNINH